MIKVIVSNDTVFVQAELGNDELEIMTQYAVFKASELCIYERIFIYSNQLDYRTIQINHFQRYLSHRGLISFKFHSSTTVKTP